MRWRSEGESQISNILEDDLKSHTILETLKVLLEICLCTLTPSSDRMSIVLESGSSWREFKQVWSSLLPSQLVHTSHGDTHILPDD